MNYARSAVRRGSALVSTPVGEAAGQPSLVEVELRVVADLRQRFIDTLPVAVATLVEGEAGALVISEANVRFWTVAGCTPALNAPINGLAFLQASGAVQRLYALLNADAEEAGFELEDRRDIRTRFHSVRATKHRPSPFSPARIILSLLDRTSEIETERTLRAEMLRDALTGLCNRLAFTDRMAALLEAKEASPPGHAVIVLDLVRFSRINESVGAIAGDELLIAFARRLLSVVGPGDVVARIGGDEFGVFLELDNGVGDIDAFVARLEQALAKPFRLSDLEIRVDCAIGCAIPQGAGEVAEELLRNAQFALRKAKGVGRMQYYAPEQAREARRRFSMETELRRAIDNGALSLHFQPLIGLAGGRVQGFEALARWEHPVEGPISATEFIAVAEESGLILPLGRWALEAALKTLASWDARLGSPLPVYMSVNLSAIQIQRDDVPSMVADALARTGIDGNRLLLEVTESAIIHDPEAATQVLNAMRGLDVRVALDDFGTGYTSLAYLQKLPIDMLKIDSRFITDMLDDPDATAIVRAILSLAESLKLSTTAEGIESEELARALRALGCTNGQGFHFAPGLWPDAALAYWASRSA